ncbi:hypothetical protein GCM10008985_30120 [Halococcus dombrowskii]|uniref:Transposase (ISH3) n=1 Tax=Halococcus dombrowskii TaxID=179637 RepID=A0AAV3SKC6_HALDO
MLELLPEQVEVIADLHLRPYYGDEDETEELYHSEAERGTTAFHAYATLYARVRNKRYTLTMRRLRDGDTTSSVLAEFLGLLEGLDPEVKAVYLDSEFYDGKCLTLLHVYNYAYVVPIIKWGAAIKTELRQGWSRTITHDLETGFDGHEWTVEFPVYIDCTYQNGQYDEHGVARHGYAVDVPFIETLSQARTYYSRRFGIESSYRLAEKTTIDPTQRLLFVVISLLFQNAWRYLYWKYVATPRRGGHRLWEWTFEGFIRMVTRAAWTALDVRRASPRTSHLTSASSANPPIRTALLSSGNAVTSAAFRRRLRQARCSPCRIVLSSSCSTPISLPKSHLRSSRPTNFVRY